MEKSEILGQVITTTNGIGALVVTSKQTRPKGYKVENSEESITNSEWACWGDDNNLPNDYRELAENDTILSGGLPFKAEMAMSGGITVGVERVENGVKIFEEKIFKEWEDFRKCDVTHFTKELLLDLTTYANAFPQFILNADRKIKGVSCTRTRPPIVRTAKHNENLFSDKIYVSSCFAEGGVTSETNPTTIPLIDSFYSPGEWLKDEVNNEEEFNKQWAMHVRTPDFGNQYYSRPFWFAAKKWLDIAALILEFKNNLIANEVRIKWLIELHPQFWIKKYGEKRWAEAMKDESIYKELVDEQQNRFEEFLTDPTNDNAVLFGGLLENKYDPKGEPVPLVRLTQFDTKVSEGAFNVDSQEATLHILFALCLHPSLFGALPGKNLGGGSGSDARVAFNQRAILQHSIQNAPIRVFEFIRDFNEWPKEMRFQFKNSLIQTLDQGEITPPSPNEVSSTATSGKGVNVDAGNIAAQIAEELKMHKITIG